MRVLGIDPGTISLDICGLEDGRVFLDRSIPTADALGDPGGVARLLESVGPVDLVAGPSGYGLPLVDARQLTEDHIRLACLSAAGEPGGIGGLSEVMRALARTRVPTVFTPGAIHLPSVPAHRKLNRIDVGTADKVCAAALAIHEEAVRRDCAPTDISLILLELGGAFSAALAVEGGQIVDGMGGSSGPIGMRGAGSLDGEVAFLAGHVSKDMLFHGGVADVPGDVGRAAFVEGALKAVAAMRVAAPTARHVLLSGRMASEAWVREPLQRALGNVRVVEGFGSSAKHAAQGAALIAEGLAGGPSRGLVETLRLREASGTVLDYLHVIDRDMAARRIGVTPSR